MTLKLIVLFAFSMLFVVAHAQSYELIQELTEPVSDNYFADLSENAEVIVISSNAAHLHIYYNVGGLFSHDEKHLLGDDYDIISTCITPDGRWIAMGGYKRGGILIKGRISVLKYQPDSNGHSFFFSFSFDHTGVYGIGISNDHQWLVAGHDYQNGMTIFRFLNETFNPYQVIPLYSPVSSVDFADNNSFLIVGLYGKAVMVFKYNGEKYEKLQEFNYKNYIIRRAELTGDSKLSTITHG